MSGARLRGSGCGSGAKPPENVGFRGQNSKTSSNQKTIELIFLRGT